MSDLREHYGRLFAAHGDAAQAVQYSDAASQRRRFDVLAEVAPVLGSVADFGCGLGHLYEYLIEREPDVRYLGLDFVDEFVRAAGNKHKSERVSFRTFDIVEDEPPDGYDYALLSGVFNNKISDNWGFMTTALRKMWRCAGRGIAFNGLSTYVDYQDDGLYYVDPCRVFDFCKRELSPYVVLRHDYLVKPESVPFEFVLYVYARE